MCFKEFREHPTIDTAQDTDDSPETGRSLALWGLYNASPFEATDQIAKRWGMKIPGGYPQRPREARFSIAMCVAICWASDGPIL